MAENLKTTKYSDGTAIPNLGSMDSAWVTIYGRLYKWYAVDNNAATKMASNGGKNVCPTGWHVPSDAEWTTLTDYLGGESVAAGKLKETGTTHWLSPNTGATNETGFTALPAGLFVFNRTYSSIGSSGYWWSSTEFSASYGWTRYMDKDNTDVGRSHLENKGSKCSVRCVRDL
jgi:uncharacterized protein (TIGR02145 family)